MKAMRVIYTPDNVFAQNKHRTNENEFYFFRQVGADTPNGIRLACRYRIAPR
ncbi:hypothetical protein ABIE50_001211 [Chitinophaga sp. OAE865]